jgi:hypothetical protein
MSDRPRPRKVNASKALEEWLLGMVTACDDVLGPSGGLDPRAVEWASKTNDPRGQAAYTMGAADAYMRTLESIRKGLRMWVHPVTGEIVGVDVQGDPMPPWVSATMN